MTSPFKIWDFGFEQRKRMSKTTQKLKLTIKCVRYFITHINLPGKCVFSAANSGEYVVAYSENDNELKENELFAVR